MCKYLPHMLVQVSSFSLILIIALFNPSSAAGLLPPTLETTLSDNNLIFDKVLPVPSISIGIQRSPILEANFTTQFESNSSDASIDWALSSPARCNYALREAQFEHPSLFLH